LKGKTPDKAADKSAICTSGITRKMNCLESRRNQVRVKLDQ